MHVRGIDGLRALSALAVFALHGTPYLPGGWVGVDVFFVISGFVITRMLKQELEETGSISIIQFYIRRALRLWPALILMVLTFTLLQNLPMREWLPSVTYTANFTRMGYSQHEDLYPIALGHTWSLAIEEQFYLLWPALLLLLLRTKNPVLWITVIVLSVSIWRLVITNTHGDSILRILNGLDTRADALMLGAIIALADTRSLARFWPAGLAFLCYITLAVEITTGWVYLIGLPLTALSAATIIAHVHSSQDGLMTRVLEWRPLKQLGVISYAFYLWHYPIIWFYHPYGRIACFLATLFMAWLSWTVIEKPIRRNRESMVKRITGIGILKSLRLSHRYRL